MHFIDIFHIAIRHLYFGIILDGFEVCPNPTMVWVPGEWILL